MRKLLIISLLGFCWVGHARRGQYKYYLDANRAEDVLAGIALRRPLYDDEWLSILGTNRKGQTYTVLRGENLWGIAGKIVAEPRYWRKLWQLNPMITNPHELEAGQILKLYYEGQEGRGTSIRIPILKLTQGGFNDLDNDSVVNVDIKNKFRPKILVVSDDSVLGEVSGAYTEKEAFHQIDEFYLYFYENPEVKPGDRFSLVRFERVLADNTQPGAPTIGNVARLLGDIEIIGKGEDLVKAEIKSMYGAIRRGDKIVPLTPTIPMSAGFRPPDDLETRIVMGEEVERKSFGQGEMILLNKGTADGMRMGYLFRVFRDQDPLTRRRRDVEPDYKGEIQVVYTGELSSVGYIARNSDPIYIGDTLVPEQNFVVRDKPKLRPRDTIEID